MKYISLKICSLIFIASLAGCGANNSPATTQDKPAEKETPASKEATKETQTVSFSNTHCPIMLAKIDPESEATSWKGKKIGYCCDGCKEEFEKLTDDEKGKALAKAEKEGVDVDHDDLDHDHHEHKDEKKS